jgi:hypothetical protein
MPAEQTDEHESDNKNYFDDEKDILGGYGKTQADSMDACYDDNEQSGE